MAVDGYPTQPSQARTIQAPGTGKRCALPCKEQLDVRGATPNREADTGWHPLSEGVEPTRLAARASIRKPTSIHITTCPVRRRHTTKQPWVRITSAVLRAVVWMATNLHLPHSQGQGS